MADFQLPRDVTRAGPQRSWVAGRVVSMRSRDLDNPESSGTTEAARASPVAGKVKGKGKWGKAKQGSRKVLEFYLCGGPSPADVLQCEAWEEAARRMLGPLIQVGAMVRVRKCWAVAFTARTATYTSSRLPVYLKLDSASEASLLQEGDHDWPSYHPVTAVECLQYLPSKTLVYVAGRLIPPAPTVRNIDWDGSTVPVSNAMIRNGADLISVGFFRELAVEPTHLKMGGVYLFQNVRTHQKQMDGGRVVMELRAGKGTSVVEAPAALAQQVDECTPDDAAGGTHWGAGVPGARKNYAEEEADWFSFCVAGHLRPSEAPQA